MMVEAAVVLVGAGCADAPTLKINKITQMHSALAKENRDGDIGISRVNNEAHIICPLATPSAYT
jgi:hypothetical protein